MRVVIAICIALLIVNCSQKKDRILPEERPMVESVYASATVQPDSLYQVYAIVAGILERNLLEEGTTVQKDQPIIEIINNTPKLNSDNAKLALQLAQQNYNGSSAILKTILDEIEAARLQFQNDSTEYFRQKRLWEQEIGTEATYDRKLLNYKLSRTNLQLLQSKYDRTQNELRTAVDQAKNNYETALITTRDYTIKSKIDGTLYALYKEPGEIVNTREPLATIGSTSDFVIELLVDEVDIVRLALQQEVIITLDAYEKKAFEGVITKIYPKKDEKNQTFKVEAVFTNSPDVMYPGLSGEANIIVAKKDKVLTIPISYLIDEKFVETDDGLTEVQTGLQNMETVEILSGITKDTYIYKPD